MYKFLVSLKKEALLFLNDKVGLVIMFGMPILLVFVITIIQNGLYSLVDGNKITLLVVNNDDGIQGGHLCTMLDSSGLFTVTPAKNMTEFEIKKKVGNKETLAALYLPNDFSNRLQDKSNHISNMVLADFGLIDSISQNEIELPVIRFYHDPVLQETYCNSVINMIYAQMAVIENSMMIENIYSQMGAGNVPPQLTNSFMQNKVKIERVNAVEGDRPQIPSATQHNVPAWTIFAMFFMVVSLGTNIVKEKTSGSFLRLKTMPSRFSLVFVSKQVVYGVIAILQVIVIFSIGYFILPMIGLPPLVFPSNILATVVVVLAISLAAVSYAQMVGTLANTQDQSNGFGAVSIIVFAALGGVWVPAFVMPDYLQTISFLSPLRWCIELFYVLFLKNGSWNHLLIPLLILIAFSLLCQSIAYFKIKFEH